MNIRYHVDLSSAERAELGLLLAGGSQAGVSSSGRRSCWQPMRG
ncbi:hypothetical protein ACVIJ6_004177 [Bradyrhizobium sp. USDA 4369]